MESQSSFHNRIEDIQSNPGSEEKIASTSPTIQTQPKNSHSLSVGGLSFLVENISHGSQDDYDDVIEKVTNPNSKSEQNSSQSERPFDNIPEISKRSPVDFWKSKTLSFLDSSKSTASSNSKPTEDDENPNNIAIDESESEFIADLIPPSKSPVKEPVTPEKKSLQPLDPPEEKVRRSPRHSQKNRETVEISDLLKAGILPVGSAMNMLGEEGIITKDGWIQYGEQKYSSFDLWFEAVCPRIGCVPSNFKPEERWTMVYVGEAPLSDFRTEYLDVFKFLPKSRRRKVFDEFQMIDREKRMKQKNTEIKDKNKSKIPRRKSTESDASHSASNSDSEHSASHSSAKSKDNMHKSSQEHKSNNTNNSTPGHNTRSSNDKKHVSPTAVKVKEENTPVTPVKIKQEKTPSSTASNSVKIKQEPTAAVPPVEVVPPVPQPPVPTVLNSNNSPVLKSVKPEPPQRNNSPPWITSPKKKKSASQSTDDGAVSVEEETLQRPPSPTKNFQKQKSHEHVEEELQTTNDDVNMKNNNDDNVNMDEEDDDEAMAEQLITDSELMNDSEQRAKTWTRKRKRAAGDESDWVPKRRKKGEVSDNTVQTTFDNFAKPAPKPKSNPNSPVKPLTRVKNTNPTKSKLTSTTDTSSNTNKDANTAEPMQVEETESQKKKSTEASTGAKEKKSPKKTKQTQLVLDTSGIVSTNKEKEYHASSKIFSTTMTPKNSSPVILGSGLKSTMLTQIIALTTKLGGSIAKEGNEPFTHLVILPNKDNKASRTIKYLTALLKGRWIVSFEWILRSQADGKWLDEEEFEINGDAVANGTPERARSIPKKENEAIQVLKGYEFYFYGKFEAPLPSLAELSSLITLAGGKMLKNEPALPTSMKEILNPTSFLICNEYDLDTIKELQIRTGREALSVQWLLDSISRLKAQELREYKLIQEESEDPLLATQNSLAY